MVSVETADVTVQSARRTRSAAVAWMANAPNARARGYRIMMISEARVSGWGSNFEPAQYVKPKWGLRSRYKKARRPSRARFRIREHLCTCSYRSTRLVAVEHLQGSDICWV